MKNILAVFLILITLCGCAMSHKKQVIKESGVWLTYSELNDMLSDQTQFADNFEQLIRNCKKLKIRNLYIHVRAFGDALYNSKFFPKKEAANKYDFDILEYVIKECHKSNIKVHAWINPYRISSASQDIDSLNSQSPAYLWMKDGNHENDINVCFSDGIYLNPAENEVLTLILNGVREIVENYDIDGIHYDDYFYPTTDASFDEKSYSQYLESTETPLNLSDWRRVNVDLLISSTYNIVKYIKKDVIFSVSPAADLDKNFNSLYADIGSWIKNGYIDVIIPQLYFGFEYPTEEFKFENLIENWKKSANRNSNVSLVIGLAVYKAKPTLAPDVSEWGKNSDIISRQIEIIDNDDDISGYVYFSYSSLFSGEEEYKKQREKITEYLK